MEMLELWEMCGSGLEGNPDVGLALCDQGGRAAGLARAWRVWHWSLGKTRWIAKDRRLVPANASRRVRTFVLFVADSMFPDAIIGTVRPHECECRPTGKSRRLTAGVEADQALCQ